MNKKYGICFILVILGFSLNAQEPRFSTAGFYELAETGREVYQMNVGWRFEKSASPDAWQAGFNDSDWEVVSVPHGLELLPEEASGSINYQGEAWYRKRFKVPAGCIGKKLVLHFEGVMGKSKFWLNGKEIGEHYGGYLPVVLDITDGVDPHVENLLVVCTDNSDDPLFPPGKMQTALDFCYFGGIYRDCWLVAHNRVYITDANRESKRAGGGLFLHTREATDERAVLYAKLHARNENNRRFQGKACFALKDNEGRVVAQAQEKLTLGTARDKITETSLKIESPVLWSPEHPYLYQLEVTLEDENGKVTDGYTRRVGIRTIEFRGEDGFWLNGKPYERKLIGVNRHQDFAIIGNALPNSLHWRDVKKLKEAGVNVIRSAHYPQDPAFMDACDELGVFVIVATPGWQFWSNNPLFEERIYDDIRNMVRRDRNHPSLLFWEPVLNETRFPETFALKAKRCVEEEYPYSGGHYVAIDPGSEGSAFYPVIYSHPQHVSGGKSSVYSAGQTEAGKVYFTREFGDNVDDWNSHNSNSRVHRSWGEGPMLTQAWHYASPDYTSTSLEALYATPRHHLGGTLWHSFDHQRGYHPQPFYGGLMDAYRQPKTSYYLFMSQRPLSAEKEGCGTGPMVYIAHEMSPFSPKDVTVYSNCEEVRLTVYESGKKYVYERSSSKASMPSPIIIFKDAFDFMELKALSRKGKQQEVYMLAEGYQNGVKVAECKRSPSRRPVKLSLLADTEQLHLRADGSDVVVLIAELRDADGTVKRLSNCRVKFSIEGEGRILNPGGREESWTTMQWGSAPVLIQATHRAGPIRIKVETDGEGLNAIEPADITLYSTPVTGKMLYSEAPLKNAETTASKKRGDADAEALRKENDRLKKKLVEFELKEVESMQEGFGESPVRDNDVEVSN